MPRLTELEAGVTFEGFLVERKLSEGGMGAVYRVKQLATGRERALKLMHPELVSNDDLRDKFIQEANIGARVQSEHVVDVVDAGVDAATGMPWLAMELLEGEDLGAVILRKGRLDLSEVATIFEQLCHAVGAAHVAGIVHRDLKPENVFLASTKRAGAPFTIKVLDFGIAKLVEEARTSSNTGLMGSPYWMAPEQTERKMQISPATDVWALGLIAYRLLTGRYYWLSAGEEGASVTVFLRELVIEPLAFASDRARQQGVGELLPAGFDAWFARCVVRDQSARFADARAALDGFRALHGGAPAGGTEHYPSVKVSVRTVNMPPVDSMALGTARTIGAEAAPPADDDEDLRGTVPTQKTPVAAIAAAVALAVGAAIYFLAIRTTAPAPDPRAGVAPTDTAKAAPDALRCPKTMAAIAGGTFSMGSETGEADEKPVHSLTLNGFCLDTTEVLVSEYAQCATEKKCPPPSSTVFWANIKPEDKALWSQACNASRADRADYPINCISWDDADNYCRWAKKRLPTEEEWEYAARGREGRLYPWGNELPDSKRVNACGVECAQSTQLGDQGLLPLFSGSDGFETTAPAQSFKDGQTPEGVFDLAGNVWEWTASHYCPYPGNNCASEWRVARGGAWNSDAREGVKATRRDKNAHDARSSDVGFRCAL